MRQIKLIFPFVLYSLLASLQGAVTMLHSCTNLDTTEIYLSLYLPRKQHCNLTASSISLSLFLRSSLHHPLSPLSF